MRGVSLLDYRIKQAGGDELETDTIKQTKQDEQKKYHARSHSDRNGLKPTTEVVKDKKLMEVIND